MHLKMHICRHAHTHTPHMYTQKENWCRQERKSGLSVGLGSIPGGIPFLSSPSPFQRSLDSNGPDYLSLDDLYPSSDLGARPSGSLCCDDTQILLKSHILPLYQIQPRNMTLTQIDLNSFARLHKCSQKCRSLVELDSNSHWVCSPYFLLTHARTHARTHAHTHAHSLFNVSATE